MGLRSVQSAIVGASLLSMLAEPALAARCAKGTETDALRTRMLQTELMVAALSCSQKAEYNDFVIHFRSDLQRNGSALQSYFRRAYGKSGTSELNSFTTRLANEVSQRSIKDKNAFCGDAAKAFTALKTLPSAQFATFVAARPSADSHGVMACTTSASDTEKATTRSKGRTAKSSTKAKVVPAVVKTPTSQKSASIKAQPASTQKVSVEAAADTSTGK